MKYLKLQILLGFCVCKQHEEENLKRRLYYNHLSYKAIKAFTLAEVLITLTIIGVVAALAIPAVIQSTQNAELQAALRKDYSILSGVGKRIAMDNGGTLKGVFNYSDAGGSARTFAKYLSVQKMCGTNFEGNCWPDRNSWTTYDGLSLTPGAVVNDIDQFYTWNAAMILNDGTLMLTSTIDNSGCTGTSVWRVWAGTGGDPANTCSSVLIDVNGFKGPNRIGKDIHIFYFKDDGSVVPRISNGRIGFEKTVPMLSN